jgi:hypothetical protein
MKIIEQQIEFNSLILTTDIGGITGKKSFCVQLKDGGDIVMGNIYEDEINLNDLFDCLSYVNNFFKK